ncbi:MAG: hypothetical protein GQ569_08780 [Methylococcaceae bacterium]|nr:hypothetical protein [Methylococcaceae bacterium]
MKKFLLLFLLSFSVFAGKETYKVPVLIEAINFQADYKDGKVSTRWPKYKRDDFLYYKVVKSANNNNPVYPEDGMIFYTEDANITAYTDEDIQSGIWYYRLCIITKDHSRWISPVITLDFNKTSSTPPTAKDFGASESKTTKPPSDKDFE